MVKKSGNLDSNIVSKGGKLGGIMSVVDNKTVDGVALTDDKKGIILLITDHLE